MDSTDTGDKTPEEKPEEAAAGEETTAEEKPPEAVAVEKAPKKKSPSKPNWMLIALIVVSCIAVLLLAATITLGVTGGACHHGRCEKSEKFGRRQKGRMHQRGEGGWRDGYPWQQNPGDKGQQAQPPQTQPVQPPQSQPVTPAVK